MKQILFLFCLLFFFGLPLADAQTYYYKLNSYGKTGTENRNVSGGQFITFQAAICMETDKSGISIGHGYLQRKANDPTLYVGSAYWGGGTKFRFSPDKSTLKVTTSSGMVYCYTRSTAPAGAKTCSLIKGSSPSAPVSSVAGGGVSGTPIKKPQTCGICSGTGKCTTCHGRGLYTVTYGSTFTCGACGGKGRCATCNGSGISGYVTEYVY